MDYSVLIEYLRERQYLTDLERDILDTVNELQKAPFDRVSAELQVKKEQYLSSWNFCTDFRFAYKCYASIHRSHG